MAILVIDIGSSSVRAALFDADAQPVPGALARRSHSFDTHPPGTASTDAEQLRQLVEACLDQVLTHPQARFIEAAGLATFVGNLLGVDADSHPVTPLYTYADTRSADDVEILRAQIDESATHQRTGCVHHTAYHPARLHWLKRTQPRRFEAATKWLDLATYLYGVWFDNRDVPCSYSVASWSGMLDRAALAWDSGWLDVLGMPATAWPPLADYHSAQQGLGENYARRWPSLRAVPFYLAVGDGAAANVGSGAVAEHTIALTIGTTSALRLISSARLPPVPAGLWSYRVDATHHLTGGATSEGGNIFQWVKRSFHLPDPATIERELTRRPPDGHGLTFLPLLAGERSPGWNANASGIVQGLRLATEPIDILQAALEGVALRLALIAGQLVEGEVAIMASGGALVESRVWAQIVANALNQPLQIVTEREVTARGVAVLVRRAMNRKPELRFQPEVETVIEPQPAHVEALTQAKARQIDLYQRHYLTRRTHSD